MTMSLSGLASGGKLVKFLVIFLLIAVPAGSLGYAIGVHLESVNTLKETNEKLKAQKEVLDMKNTLSETKLLALQEIRQAEIDANSRVQEARKQLEREQTRVKQVIGQYSKKLAERNETPGKLSTSAVETINQIVTGANR